MANVHIHGVPDDVHRRLKSHAALAGQSLDEYLLDELRGFSSRPTIREIIARVRELPPYDGPSVASIIREDRDSR